MANKKRKSRLSPLVGLTRLELAVSPAIVVKSPLSFCRRATGFDQYFTERARGDYFVSGGPIPHNNTCMTERPSYREPMKFCELKRPMDAVAPGAHGHVDSFDRTHTSYKYKRAFIHHRQKDAGSR